MSILDKLKSGNEDLAKLKITTVIGKVEWQDGKPVPAADAKKMYSELDLIDQKIDTYIEPEFIEPEMMSIRQFHQAKEDDGRSIVEKNVEILRSLAELINYVSDNDKDNDDVAARKRDDKT